MIIELYGPPGVGKTTFARALSALLRERGHVAELKLSYRPTEGLPVLNPYGATAGRYQNAVIQRLSRPVVELLTIARHPFANSRDFRTARHLVRLLPPANVFSSIKTSQYLSRLSHSWYEKSHVAHLVLFDQAFVQAVCSLTLLAGAADDTLVANALDYAPKSDVFIRLEAPVELLETRLNDRRRLQGTIGQLFEHDLTTSFASIPMIDRLHNLLLKQGRFVLCASSVDQRSLDESVDMVAQKVIAKFKAEHRRAA
jgi:thymidylate kinase